MKRIEVNRPWIPDREKLFDMFNDILDRGALTNNGEYVKRLEAALSRNTGIPHVYTTSNGTIALHMALKALELEGTEIITTPFSFIATTSSILWERCTPVFVDVEPDTLCINPERIKDRITKRTGAILGVHVFGNACNIDAIREISEKHQIKTIYDGAHAFGVRYKGRSIFDYGTISTLSMHASKVLSSVEGGAVFCRDHQLAESIYKIRYFGKNRDNVEEMQGINGKMSEFNAAFGLLSLEQFDQGIAKRKTIAETYISALEGKSGVGLLDAVHNDNHNYAYFPLLLTSETDVLALIAKALTKEIIIRRYWHPALNTISYVNSDPAETPIAVSAADRIVCLPIYSEMTVEDTQRVIDLF